MNRIERLLGIITTLQTKKYLTAEKIASKYHIQTMQGFSLNFGHLSILQEAISNKQLIELDYKNSKHEISNRKVEPIGLIFYAYNWHLVDWCYKKADYRDFRVSRITKIKTTFLPFKISNHINLNEYMKRLPVNY